MRPPPTQSRRRPGARQMPASRAHCSGRSLVPRLVAQRPSIVLPHALLLLLHLLGQFLLRPYNAFTTARRAADDWHLTTHGMSRLGWLAASLADLPPA